MKIASFNVRRFGLAKMSDRDVLSTLVKIVSRYDIIVILEVVDVSGGSVNCFLRELNRINTTNHYTLKLSIRLGRTRYKEQFLFLYRDNMVDLIDSYQYEDNQVDDLDAFAREPYILHFRPHNTVLTDLVLIPVHTKPEDSEKELDELYEVFLAVRDKWKTDNIMILGDFNADGAYVTHTQMKEIRIRTDNNFHWLIDDDMDTTAHTGNQHTYDRIVVYGRDMFEAVVPNSAKPFNFQTEFGLTEEMALRVSDHYPVELELCSWSPAQPSPSRGAPIGQEPPEDATPPTTEECLGLPCCSTGPHHFSLTLLAMAKRSLYVIEVSVQEGLQVDVLKLKKENLLLEQEKLHLGIKLLKRKLAMFE